MSTLKKEQKYNEKYGKSLLHVASSYYCEEDVLMKIIKLFPESVKQKNGNGDYPLHIACRRNQSEDAILRLIQLFPMAVQHQNNDKKYPLHLANIDCKPDYVMLTLLDLFPEAVRHKCDSSFGLHMVCTYCYSASVIKKIIEINRKELNEKDRNGHYPIHCAILSCQSDDIIKVLIDEDPLACQRLNRKGESPFHMAYDYSRGHSGFHCLVDGLLQQPDIDINVKDINNNTLLHIASMCGHTRFIHKLLNHPFIMIDQKNNKNKTSFDLLKERTKQIEKGIARAILNNYNDTYSNYVNRCSNDDLSSCLEVIKLLEEFPIKQRWNAYLYHVRTVVDS